MRPLGALYVHVPFCARKCAYCDFLSEATPADDPCLGAYVKNTMARLRALGEAGLLASCRSAYVGGGTPSFLGAGLLSDLIRCVRDVCPNLEEFTFEANPDSLTSEVLAKASEAGATRVSIGVQSLVDAELAAIGRIHDANEARRAVCLSVSSSLDVSCDLMCAIPHQTDGSWRRSLEETIDLGVAHVSVYPLTIEEHTPFFALYAQSDPAWNSEDVQADRMELACDVLEQAGYRRYEVASYALAGHECSHNKAYWTGVPYLGVGPGAASMLALDGGGRLRFCEPDFEWEFLSAREAWAEDLMLGMRLVAGVEAERIPIYVRASLEERGLARLEDDRMVPTHDGWLFGNELYGALWDLRNTRDS